MASQVLEGHDDVMRTRTHTDRREEVASGRHHLGFS